MESANSVKFGEKDFVLSLRVFGHKVKSGKWAAHCLETDLVGYGKTLKAALNELTELTEMQVSFAFHKNQPALLDRPAPIEIIEAYTSLLRSVLQNFTTTSKADKKRAVTSIPWPSHLKKADGCFVQAGAS